ncbi:MAG: FHA domain-containing protein [Nannocystaceae bacterium]
MPQRLIIENLDGVTTIVPLGSSTLTIGRTAGNTIQLSEQNVSRAHAKLLASGSSWEIQDQSSYNGITVNGATIEQTTTLHEGDLVQIGDYHLVLTDSSDKQTVDLGRPRRSSNQEEPFLASSSADLPRLSASEVSALITDTGVGDESHATRRFPWLAVTIAVGCIAIMTLVAYAFSGDEVASPRSPAASDTAATSHPTRRASDSRAEPLLEDGDDFPMAKLLSSTGGRGEDPSAGSARRHRSGASRRRRGRSGRPKAGSAENAKVALRQARSAAASGRPGRAYDMASKSYGLAASQAALLVMGQAGCQLRQSSKARRAYRKLSDARQLELASFCAEFGIDF